MVRSENLELVATKITKMWDNVGQLFVELSCSPASCRVPSYVRDDHHAKDSPRLCYKPVRKTDQRIAACQIQLNLIRASQNG